MNDLDIVTVRIEHPCRIIARIVFGPSLRCFLALASGGHSSLYFRAVSTTLWDYAFIEEAICPDVPIYAASVGLVSAPFPSHGTRWYVPAFCK